MGKKLKQNVFSQVLMLTPEQITGFIKYFNEVSYFLELSLQVEHSEYLKFNNLWDIKTKTNMDEQDDTENIALTISDIEEKHQQEVDFEDDILNNLCKDKDKELDGNSFSAASKSKLVNTYYIKLAIINFR